MRIRLLLIFLAIPARVMAADYQIIAYHDVRDSVLGDYDADQYATSTTNLLAHFRWLGESNFEPVSVEQILDAEAGRATLPENAVLLTFDDGLRSFYTRVYPLLKLFGYPAVVSVVSSWIDTDGTVNYPSGSGDGPQFLTWEQIREMQASGLVEVGSHSHDLHKGITGNPQGSLFPAAVTRQFEDGSYEDAAAYRRRIEDDLARSVAAIAEQTGHPPRVITWPFGAFNDVVSDIAYELGMRLSLTLEPGNSEYRGLHHRGRILITGNPPLADLTAELLQPGRPDILRVAQVDLDYVYDADPKQQSANLDRLLDRIKALEISHVYLQAYADPDGDGAADALYFPNRHLPVRADLFSRVAWALKTRADVRVYAWLPMLGFSGGPFRDDMRVVTSGSTASETDDRLSPFHPEAIDLIAEIYEDLAIYARFDGLLFHDDGRLNELEDYNSEARKVYRAKLGVVPSFEDLQSDPLLRHRFTQLKVQSMIALTDRLSNRVRRYVPALRTARNLFASALLDTDAADYLGQDYDAFLGAYDYVALLAMPGLERTPDSRGFFEALVAAAAGHNAGLEKTIFELQTVDWANATKVDGRDLRRTMRWLQSLGVRHLGYYPDDFIEAHPPLEDLRSGMSLAEVYGGSRQ